MPEHYILSKKNYVNTNNCCHVNIAAKQSAGFKLSKAILPSCEECLTFEPKTVQHE